MEYKDEIILGCDLGNEYMQVSWLGKEHTEPQTLSTVPGEERFQIPAVLGRDKDRERWTYGTEARKMAVLGEGILVADLLEACRRKDPVQIGEESCEPVKLLSLFLTHIVQFVQKTVGDRSVRAVMFTVEEMDEDLAAVIKSAATHAGFGTDQIFIQDYYESFYYYVIAQPKELWHHGAVLFTYEHNEIGCHELRLDRQKKVVFCSVESATPLKLKAKAEQPEISDEAYDKMLDIAFSDYCKACFGKKLISSVYLTGDGFDGDWKQASLKQICQNRRVFQGKNLYTKGACYTAKEKLQGNSYPEHIYSGAHKIQATVSMQVTKNGKKEHYLLAEAGDNWFEAGRTCEFILKGSPEITVEVQSFRDGSKKEQKINLVNLPERPEGTLRLRLELVFLTPDKCRIRLLDTGFGELFPASSFEAEIEIEV